MGSPRGKLTALQTETLEALVQRAPGFFLTGDVDGATSHELEGFIRDLERRMLALSPPNKKP